MIRINGAFPNGISLFIFIYLSILFRDSVDCRIDQRNLDDRSSRNAVADSDVSTKNEDDDEEDVIALWMPRINTTTEDEYHCLGKTVDFDIRYIIKYVPHASAKQVHHILIYGCSVPIDSGTGSNAWKCRDDHPVQSACKGRSKLLFAWAKDAPAFQLPKDVGFYLGRSTDVQGLFIQIHYSALVTNDDSGISLIYTSQPRKYAAGILLLAAGGQVIPPHQAAVDVNMMCTYNDDVVLHPFGFRTHAHGLGTVISGWYIKPEDIDEKKWTMMGKQSPQNPQAFYPMAAPHNITKGTILGGRCVFNSTERKSFTFMGPTHNDEMCNFYMMYYADRITNNDGCTDVDSRLEPYFQLPEEASVPLPASEIIHHHSSHGGKKATVKPEHNMDHEGMTQPVEVATAAPRRKPLPETPNVVPSHGREGEMNIDNDVSNMEQHEHGHNLNGNMEEVDQQAGMMGSQNTQSHMIQGIPKESPRETGFKEDTKWSETVSSLKLGQISGVALDSSQQNLYIFHRNDHEWNMETFDMNYRYLLESKGPIAGPTILVVNALTGEINSRLGVNMFYMPHGITVDHENNIWVADVALHQIFKIVAGKPALTLGKRFVPGHDGSHFCQPTSIAVMKSGDFFVADGYCNQRIIRFDKAGKYIGHIGRDVFSPFASISPGPEDFNVPHDVKLSSDEKTLYVADRENGRIVAFEANVGMFKKMYKLPEFGFRLFALDVADDLLVAVNGRGGINPGTATVNGILVNLTTGNSLGTLSSQVSPLQDPHAVTISRDGNNIYIVELDGRAHKFQRQVPLVPHFNLLTSTSPSSVPSASKTTGERKSINIISTYPTASQNKFSILFSALIAVPTLIIIVGVAYCCCKSSRNSSSQSKWKELLYRYGDNVKNPMDLHSYRARKQGFRPLVTQDIADNSSDSEDEAFSARKYQRNALA